MQHERSQDGSPVPAGSMPGSVEITDFDEVRDAWQRRALSAHVETPGDEHFRAGTVLRLDGEEHARRRRAMGQLLKRRGHQYFRDRWLFPTADAALADVLARPGPDGIARVDLLAWARRVNQQLAAALVGFDGATTAEGALELFHLANAISRGNPPAFVRLVEGFDPEGERERAALAAQATIVERFFNPAMERREAMVRRVRDGQLSEEELPQDLLTLIALGSDPAWQDRSLAERESVFVLAAGVHTTSISMIWTLVELFAWLQEHPEDRGRCTEDEFLLRAVNEALRLHPVVPGFARLAKEHVRLPHGTEVQEGQLAMIRSGPAGVDSRVYGTDADRFDPFRELPPRVYPYGFAFGAGPHMCYGAPIVMGSEGLDGSLVYLLRIVLQAGLHPDPDAQAGPLVPLAQSRGRYVTPPDSYPVAFSSSSSSDARS